MRPRRPFDFSVLLAAVLVWAASVLGGCGSEDPVQRIATRPESFTFMEIGVNTAYTPELQDQLSSRLGAVAVERRGLLNLRFSTDDFFKSRLPALAKLNLNLNPASGERREHDLISLTYRYPGRLSPAFNRVRLVFSRSTRRPMMFRIHANQAGGEILSALTEKYGAPDIEKSGEAADTRYRLWRRHGDVLAVASSPDRFGLPEYRIAFYFTENIKDLVLAEKTVAEQAEEARRKAGKSAF